MTTEEKLDKLIEILAMFAEAEACREINSTGDSQCNYLMNALEDLSYE